MSNVQHPPIHYPPNVELPPSHYSPNASHLNSDSTTGATASYYTIDSVVKPSSRAELPLRTRDRDSRDHDHRDIHDRDHRDRYDRKEKRSLASTRNNSSSMRPPRPDRTPSIPVPNTVSEESKPLSFFRWRAPWSSTPAPTDRAPEVPSKPPHIGAVDLEDYFLQPVEDSQIHRGAQGLKHAIDSHVYNHYGDIADPPSNEVIIRIVNHDGEDWRAPSSLLSEESYRLAAIRLSIARFMFDRIEFDGDPNTTFLPPDIVSLLGMASQHHTEKFRFAASASLRRTAANLLRLNQQGESVPFTRQQEVQIRCAANDLHDRLKVLASPGSEELSRKAQLEAIMKKGAQIGALLLLQSATYEFDWSITLERSSSKYSTGEQTSRRVRRERRIMTFPALLRVGDNTGRQLRKPDVLCKPEYMEEEYGTESGRASDSVRSAP